MKGRKRHLLVDTQGFLLQPVVHSADLADRDGGKVVLERLQPWQERFPRMKHLWLECGSRQALVDGSALRLGRAWAGAPDAA